MQIYKFAIAIFSLFLLFFISNTTSLFAQSNSFKSDSIFGLEEPDEFKNNNYIPDFLKEKDTYELPRPIGGFGNLHVIIESVKATNHNIFSQKALRAELRLEHNILSSLDSDDVKVINSDNSRYFDFPVVSLRSGYYFITVRLYSDGFIWKNRKYYERTFQVGIHEGQTTTVRKKLPFLHW